VVLRDVPSDCTVVGIPGRIIYRSGVKIDPLDHNHLPDSEAKVIRMLLNRIEQLEQTVAELQQSQGQLQLQPQLQAHLEAQLQAQLQSQLQTQLQTELQTQLQTQLQVQRELHSEFQDELQNQGHPSSVQWVYTRTAESPRTPSPSCGIHDWDIQAFFDGSGI
jgi:serine O-acetyltransferase